MEVSTQAEASGPDVGARRGARHALRLAALFAPGFLPLAPATFALICIPWLDSLQAQTESDMLLLRSDAVARQALATWTTGLGGTLGLLSVGLLLSILWLILLRHWQAWNPGSVIRAILARHGSPKTAVVLSLACAAVATSSIQLGARPLARFVDIAAGLGPTRGASLATVALSQGLVLLLLGACAGSVIASLETARMPRARLGALGIVLAIGFVGGAAQNLGATWLARRIDVQRSLADIVGSSRATPPRVEAVILARDRLWRFQVQSGLDEVAFDSRLARRAEDWVSSRNGWSLLGPRLDAYVVGERLLALDPGDARQACLRALSGHGATGLAHPLLASLATAHADALARATLAEVADAAWLERGPVALHLIARAAGMQGDRRRAELALAQLRAIDGERRLVSVRSVPPIVLADLTDGRVHGTLILDGRALEGRVGLISTQDLFEMPETEFGVPVTWLLRLGGAVELGPGGSFTFEHVGPGEHALVLLDRGHLTGLAHAPLARIVLTPATREIALGEISLSTAKLPAQP